MENIIIYDDMFTQDDIDNCNKIIDNNNWKFGHHSLYKINLIKDNIKMVHSPFWYLDLDTYDLFTNILFKKIEKITKKKFILLRVYANGQTYGQDSTFHPDTNDDQNTYTFVFYINNITEEQSDILQGNFEIKIPNKKYFISIPTIYNRAILFPSIYIHRGLAYSRYTPTLRICIAWKLKEII